MTDKNLESLLLGARPTPKQHSAFTKQVMAGVYATSANPTRTTSKQPKWSLLMKLRTLHGTGLVVAILAVMVLLTGVVYAGIRFAPDFIQLFNKRTNEQGRTEYTVPSFAQCQDSNTLKLDTFAVKPNAGIDDTEVRKIVQAKCELEGINKFVSDTWPTYGQNKEWHDGDTIYFTRPNIMGIVENVNKNSVTLAFGGQKTETFQTFENKDLLAYTHGQKIPADNIKPGDFVFVIERVAETYYASPKTRDDLKQDGAAYIHSPAEPKRLGVIAVVKMSQPQEYYRQKQSLIYEVQPCNHNPGETCPKEFQVGIDIFPRGSEGATNPNLRKDPSAFMREINGIVTNISADTLTIKSNKGNDFTVRIAKSVIDAYNTHAAPIYQQDGRIPLSTVSVGVGSWLSITYVQTVNDNPHNIQLADIFKIYLQTDLSRK